MVVVLTDPDSIEKLVKQDKSCRREYLDRKLGDPFLRNGLLCLDGDKWRKHLKNISSNLHVNILETFVENFAKNSDILANKLNVLADGITAHDIYPYFIRCTLDITVQTSSGIDINAQTDNDDSTLESITTAVDMIAVRLFKPWLLIEWLFKASVLGMIYHKAANYVHGKIINETGTKKRMRGTADKRGLNEEKPSFLDPFIQCGDITKEEIVGEIVTIISAGTETTSIACGYVLALLGDNQHIQAKVVQEQQEIFGDDSDACEKQRSAKDGVPRTGRQLLDTLFSI